MDYVKHVSKGLIIRMGFVSAVLIFVLITTQTLASALSANKVIRYPSRKFCVC